MILEIHVVFLQKVFHFLCLLYYNIILLKNLVPINFVYLLKNEE